MNLEPITELSKFKREEKHILTHIYGIQEDGTDEPICRAAMEMQIQRTDLWTQGSGKEVEGGMNGESKLGNIYTTVCKIDNQWKFAI